MLGIRAAAIVGAITGTVGAITVYATGTYRNDACVTFGLMLGTIVALGLLHGRQWHAAIRLGRRIERRLARERRECRLYSGVPVGQDRAPGAL
jgi:sulfite exporter TauE/SafE